MAGTFDAATLAALHATNEVRLRSGTRTGRGVIIWIVVADGAAYVRSVRGPTGKWFVAAEAAGQASLLLGEREVAVSVTPVADPTTIEAVSQAFLTKYATSPYAKSIVAPATLGTTLRLDPT